jgi:hypothetical protein
MVQLKGKLTKNELGKYLKSEDMDKENVSIKGLFEKVYDMKSEGIDKEEVSIKRLFEKVYNGRAFTVFL